MAKRPSTLPAASVFDQLTAGVLEGLHKSPKELSSVWFYDELGSALFDQICELPEYYLTRTEQAIMQQHAAAMARHIGPGVALIEFGSGTSVKTRLLLDQLEQPAAYIPVDISREPLLEAAGLLAHDYPALPIIPVCADFTQPIDLPKRIATARRRVIYFPGSTLGNFMPDQAQLLLAAMHRIVGRDGALLIGIDLKKNPQVLQRAYDDPAGVTAQFNLNALRHINHELGANFNLGAFEHRALWREDQGRMEMHLISTRDQIVDLGGEHIAIGRGEHLRTECCHKYTLDGFVQLAAGAHLAVTQVWTDTENKFSVQLLQPVQ